MLVVAMTPVLEMPSSVFLEASLVIVGGGSGHVEDMCWVRPPEYLPLWRKLIARVYVFNALDIF